jgi:hypothetical protein
MASAKWWVPFYAKYKDAIDQIHHQALLLEEAGTSAHVNARLYSWKDRFVGIDEKAVIVVAPYVMGWIDTLDRTEPITKQAAITKRAQGGSAVRAAFATVLTNEARSDRSYQAVAAFLATA